MGAFFGAAAPAGSSGQPQFNSGGAMAGMAGAAWDDTNRSLTISGATVTASKPLLSLSQTWNAIGTTFTGFLLNILKTAAAGASLVFDIQVDSVSFLSMNTSGHLNVTRVTPATGGTQVSSLDTGGLGIGSGGTVGFASGNINFSGSCDAFFRRDTANVLAQRNSTNAQQSRVYNTGDSTNGEFAGFDWQTSANIARVRSSKNGTGTLRPLVFDAYSMSGAPTATQLPAGTAGVFKDTGGGGVVLAYNDGGTITTVALV